MNILIIGAGGRSHTLAWKMAKSPYCSKLFIAPGNGGTTECGTNVNIDVNDFKAQKEFCLNNDIALLVVGPEEPLVKGVYDFFAEDEATKHIIIIGPSSKGAQLEGSKAFSKKFMERHNIPTALYREFDESTFSEGEKYILEHSLPIVLKADGLAAGKGVVICSNHQEAVHAFKQMILHKQFGEASSKVVIEQFLEGIEASLFVLTDGNHYQIIGHAKDYKRIGEGDIGPNTGGMGCVSPVPFVNDSFLQKVKEKIIDPTIEGIKQEKINYNGFIFFGLISVNGEPYLIEYNCRMGDPETEVVIPRLKNDLVELFMTVKNGDLPKVVIEFDERACATVVAVSGGYPGAYKKNVRIYKPEHIKMKADESFIFHAGTKKLNDTLVTNGGRVFAVTSFGKNIAEAVKNSKEIIEQIHFDGMFYRRDIGYEFEQIGI